MTHDISKTVRELKKILSGGELLDLLTSLQLIRNESGSGAVTFNYSNGRILEIGIKVNRDTNTGRPVESEPDQEDLSKRTFADEIKDAYASEFREILSELHAGMDIDARLNVPIQLQTLSEAEVSAIADEYAKKMRAIVNEKLGLDNPPN